MTQNNHHTSHIFSSAQIDNPYYWRNKILNERSVEFPTEDIDSVNPDFKTHNPIAPYSPKFKTEDRIKEILLARNGYIEAEKQITELNPNLKQQIELEEQKAQQDRDLAEARKVATRFMSDAINAQDPVAIGRASTIFAKVSNGNVHRLNSSDSKQSSFVPTESKSVIDDIIKQGPRDYTTTHNNAVVAR